METLRLSPRKTGLMYDCEREDFEPAPTERVSLTFWVWLRVS